MPWNVPDDEKINYCKRIGKVIADADRWGIPTMLEPIFLVDPASSMIIKAEMEVARLLVTSAPTSSRSPSRPDATAKLCDELDIPIVVAAGGPLSGDAP